MADALGIRGRPGEDEGVEERDRQSRSRDGSSGKLSDVRPGFPRPLGFLKEPEGEAGRMIKEKIGSEKIDRRKPWR